MHVPPPLSEGRLKLGHHGFKLVAVMVVTVGAEAGVASVGVVVVVVVVGVVVVVVVVLLVDDGGDGAIGGWW